MTVKLVTKEKIAETSSKGNQENGTIKKRTDGTNLTSSDMKL